MKGKLWMLMKSEASFQRVLKVKGKLWKWTGKWWTRFQRNLKIQGKLWKWTGKWERGNVSEGPESEGLALESGEQCDLKMQDKLRKWAGKCVCGGGGVF